MVQKWVAELKAKTGHTLEEWVALVQKKGPKTDKDWREWLKRKYNLGTNSAQWIAERAEGRRGEKDSPEAYLAAATSYVEAQYSGKRRNLRSIFENLLQLAADLGADVKACPTKTMVPLYRKHVFALIRATTITRVDLGLALAAYQGKLPKRALDTGGLAKKDRITHRIGLTEPSQIDEEVHAWLKTAYELDGKASSRLRR
jgi:hypothetical protein